MEREARRSRSSRRMSQARLKIKRVGWVVWQVNATIRLLESNKEEKGSGDGF